MGASSAPLATGVVAIVSLPLGQNPVRLVVSDGSLSASNLVDIEVITTSEAVDHLAELVESDAANPEPLVSSLRAAIASVGRSNPTAAINQLQAFKRKVLAQVSPVDPELADTLLADAQAAIDAINASTAPAIDPAVITSIQLGSRGKAKLTIRGSNIRTHLVEESSNARDWVSIGVAKRRGNAVFDFEDLQTERSVNKFYRVVSPK